VKVTAGVGVELMQIYLSGCRSHQPSDAPQQTSPNPTYKMEEQGPPSLLPLERQVEEEGTNFFAGEDGREKKPPPPVS
jgi:hypothetical protein